MSAEKLVADLADLMAALSAEDGAREAYQGDSWGYAGYRHVERRQNAAAKLTATLNAYIDELIDARMQDRRGA